MGWIRRDDVEKPSILYTGPKSASHQFYLHQRATTLIVITQGVQSVYSPVQGFFDGNYAFSLAFDSIFYSLAFLGLMRLPAALWLTEDYSYMDIDKVESTAGEEMDGAEMEVVTTKPGSIRALSTTGLPARDSRFSTPQQEMFHPSNSWRGMLIRIVFLIPLIGSATFRTAFIGQSQPGYGLFFTETYLVLISFYLILTVGVTLIFFRLFLDGKHEQYCFAMHWNDVVQDLYWVLDITNSNSNGCFWPRSKEV
jgi:hypothetical protein